MIRVLAILAFFIVSVKAQAQEVVSLSKEQYLDKCKGAWAGQMIGVCYGAPYEFKFNAKIMEDPIRPWSPELVAEALEQDDCYVEMTFLQALEEHGLEITNEQAGQAFAKTEFPLWHANKFGRENVRRGIMPPLSGHPDYNSHADDIDFQIEADLFGIICPGMPQESNRLCDIFGHIMNYGDGVYGGMFVAGMYVAAYFEDKDVEKVVQYGLACIPKESLYHQCISDVIKWHAENPGDWRATWAKLEEKWQDDVDCQPGDPVNIDAKINGAYIVMGLLYGDGDLEKTLEVSTRCGQDNDCNPSSAAGVLCCMKGFKALDEHWTGGIAKIASKKFINTDYSWNTLIPACQKMVEALIKRAGGEVAADEYKIPKQAPVAAKLEQWTDKLSALKKPIPEAQMKQWDAAWKVTACGREMDPGVTRKQYGEKNVLVLHPVTRKEPAVITADIAVPAEGSPSLRFKTTSNEKGDYLLKVFVADESVSELVVNGHGKWQPINIDLKPYAGKTVPVRIENHANGWEFEAAYLTRITIK